MKWNKQLPGNFRCEDINAPQMITPPPAQERNLKCMAAYLKYYITHRWKLPKPQQEIDLFSWLLFHSGK